MRNPNSCIPDTNKPGEITAVLITIFLFGKLICNYYLASLYPSNFRWVFYLILLNLNYVFKPKDLGRGILFSHCPILICGIIIKAEKQTWVAEEVDLSSDDFDALSEDEKVT